MKMGGRYKPLVAVRAGAEGLRLVDVGDALAEVEGGVAAGVHTLDADERLLLVLVAEATAVAKEHGTGEQLRLHSGMLGSKTTNNKNKKTKKGSTNKNKKLFPFFFHFFVFCFLSFFVSKHKKVIETCNK